MFHVEHHINERTHSTPHTVHRMSQTSDSRSATRRKLGRGLGSLISTPVRVEVPPASTPSPAARPESREPHDSVESQASVTSASPSVDGLQSLPIRSIVPNPRQPRQHFDEAALNALAGSIRVSGIMQPVVVRRASSQLPSVLGQAFELIAGERRWRAAQIAGLTHIPAVIRDVDDRTAAEFSLVENIQREDLNPLERAEAFDRLLREFSLSHTEIAERVGLNRSSVSNHLRLLELDDVTKSALADGRLSMGHARALLAITNIESRRALTAEAVRNDWSVREIERQSRAAVESGDSPKAGGADTAKGSVSLESTGRDRLPSAHSAHLANLEKLLAEHLGTKVHIHPGRNKGSGKLVIDFYSIDQFEGLLRRLDIEVQS